MGVTLTDVLLFGKAQSDDVDNATLVIYRRNILRWSALGGYLDIIVKGVSPISLPDAIADSLEYLKAFGGTEQGLPSEYQLYTEVEAGGVTYTYSSQNLTQIPCMRIADNVFGLYNLITQTFISEV